MKTIEPHQVYLRFFGLRIWHIYDKRTTRTLCGKDAGYYSTLGDHLPDQDGRLCQVCFGQGDMP